MKTDLSKFDNSWYKPDVSKVKQVLWYFCNALVFKSSMFPVSRIKTQLLRLFGATVGKGVNIKPCVNIKYPWKLKINDYAWIGENVWIDNLGEVHIGSNACISQGAMLLCGNHNYKKETFDLIVGNIYIGEGAWIGANCTVCPGITCGSHSILTVGSIATHNLDDYSIYSGNPAVKVRERK
jgi:putative colanic acid biosynthesis acetyltransferase WcaF